MVPFLPLPVLLILLLSIVLIQCTHIRTHTPLQSITEYSPCQLIQPLHQLCSSFSQVVAQLDAHRQTNPSREDQFPASSNLVLTLLGRSSQTMLSYEITSALAHLFTEKVFVVPKHRNEEDIPFFEDIAVYLERTGLPALLQFTNAIDGRSGGRTFFAVVVGACDQEVGTSLAILDPFGRLSSTSDGDGDSFLNWIPFEGRESKGARNRVVLPNLKRRGESLVLTHVHFLKLGKGWK